MRLTLLAVLATLGSASAVHAQEAPWKFRWKQGQTLIYRVELASQTSEVVPDGKLESTIAMKLTKRWQVLAVDNPGVATVQCSFDAMRLEIHTPSGEILLFDSADPDKSTPQFREQTSKLVGVPLATLRIDKLGQVLEVKASKLMPASRSEMQRPFAVLLPGTPVKQNESWQRSYLITQEPPEGTGEQYDAMQRFTCKRSDDATATIGTSIVLKDPPKALADQMPLLREQPDGEVVFDVKNGRLQSVSWKVNKELKGHQGAGTSYKFQSTYTEQFVEPSHVRGRVMP